MWLGAAIVGSVKSCTGLVVVVCSVSLCCLVSGGGGVAAVIYRKMKRGRVSLDLLE